MAGNPIQAEQDLCLRLQREGKSRSEIAQLTGLGIYQVKRRLSGALKRERLDPTLVERLAGQGINDLAGLHSGWLMEKDAEGSGSSLYFFLGPDQEKISFADAVKDVLSEIPRAPLVEAPDFGSLVPNGQANWIFLADWHIGGEYGAEHAVTEMLDSFDDIMARCPIAEKAVICGLGDLLDANDHKGVTPASGNPTDTIRDNHFVNTRTALRMMKHVAYRALESHPEVEFHMIRGNHDETAYIAVLLALAEHFADNPRITISVPESAEEEEFRVISWGGCAFFPSHGDKAKPNVLKDVWADQFPDEWAAAKVWRLIATGHFHTPKTQELNGAEHRQFGTPHRPNRWARFQGYFNRGRVSILTVHKELGLRDETHSNLKPMLKGRLQ